MKNYLRDAWHYLTLKVLLRLWLLVTFVPLVILLLLVVAGLVTVIKGELDHQGFDWWENLS